MTLTPEVVVLPETDNEQPPRNQNYKVCITRDRDLVEKALALRFQVFHLEMGKGPKNSQGLDEDRFDQCCAHVIVNDNDNNVVGTYRMQTGLSAKENYGYYSATEFDMTPFEPARSSLVELGRACVDIRHRNRTVLSMLWSGVARYATVAKTHYLLGCSSINSVDPTVGAYHYRWLEKEGYLAGPEFTVSPRVEGACPLDQVSSGKHSLPKLFGLYLSVGAKVCGIPFIDGDFGTTDFLTLVDLRTIPSPVKRRYFERNIEL